MRRSMAEDDFVPPLTRPELHVIKVGMRFLQKYTVWVFVFAKKKAFLFIELRRPLAFKEIQEKDDLTENTTDRNKQ